MEMLLLAMILAKVVQNGVVDIAFAVRGKPSPRWGSSRRWRPDGAFSRWLSQVWADTWDDALAKHSERRARRQAPATRDRPRSPMVQFLAGLTQDGRRAAHRSWDGAWVRADERRRARTTRPRPGQQTVPGTVVPNRDETQDRPQDETRPEPKTVPTEDTSTDPQDNTDPPTDSPLPQDELDQDDNQTIPTPLGDTQATPNTQEGTTTMTATIPTGEVTGLESGITFSETSAHAYQVMVGSIEQTMAALDGFDVGGPARAAAAAAMEQSAAAAASMSALAEELKKHRIVAEAIDATAGAGKREFYTAGR